MSHYKAVKRPIGYALVVLCSNEVCVRIGRREACLEPGTYVYVGSANLRSPLKRVLRHFTKGKRVRWHIDMLTEKCCSLYALLAYGLGEDGMYELMMNFNWARAIVPGFGSTDKKQHITHLFKAGVGHAGPEEVITELLGRILTAYSRRCSMLEIVSA